MLYSQYLVNFVCALNKLGTLAPRSTLFSKKQYLSMEQNAIYGIFEQIVNHFKLNERPRLKLLRTQF